MDLVDIFIAQVTDPFRIGLIVMLVFTAARTSGTVGMLTPLALGIVFVAVLIPTTLVTAGDPARQIAVGLITNLVLLGCVLALKLVLARLLAAGR